MPPTLQALGRRCLLMKEESFCDKSPTLYRNRIHVFVHSDQLSDAVMVELIYLAS